MNCECGGHLRVRHTFPAGSGAQAREHQCEKCGKRRTSITFLVNDRKVEGGAKEMVKKIIKGEVKYATKTD